MAADKGLHIVIVGGGLGKFLMTLLQYYMLTF